jgi:hypothetical protein
MMRRLPEGLDAASTCAPSTDATRNDDVRAVDSIGILQNIDSGLVSWERPRNLRWEEESMMRSVGCLAALAIAVVGLNGCVAVATPAVGVLFTDVKYGDTATTSTSATREGKACAQSILAMVATGDASIAAAKANGGVTEVSYVDHTAHSILGIVGEWCTIVKGK